MTITSTIPAAINALKGYMDTVASANPSLNVGVTIGEPIEYVTNNFMAVGDYETWELFSMAEDDWPVLPAVSKQRSEEYTLHGCIRAWSGNSDPAGRITDVFTLWDALYEQIVSDPSGGGSLSPSGSWGRVERRCAANGPLGGSGWGVVLGFDLHVISARIFA